MSGRGRGRVDRLVPHPYWNANRGGKGDEQQYRADLRRKAHIRWVNAQLNRAQVQRDQKHKASVRAFYAEKRKKANRR